MARSQTTETTAENEEKSREVAKQSNSQSKNDGQKIRVRQENNKRYQETRAKRERDSGLTDNDKSQSAGKSKDCFAGATTIIGQEIISNSEMIDEAFISIKWLPPAPERLHS